MTKVKGSHFARAMEFNFIQISQGTIRIHSFDKNGLGLLRNETNEFKEAADPLKFSLSKSDMAVLAKFEELEITMKNNTIGCTSGSSSFRLQNNTNIRELAPDMKEMKNLNISVSTYAEAAAFAGAIKDDGVLVADSGVTMFDSSEQFLFRQIIDTGIEKMVNIPTGMLKIIDKDKPYMLMANEKAAALRTSGEIVYGPLFLKLNEQAVKFDPQPEGLVKIFNAEEFIKHLKISSSFSKLITLTIRGNVLCMESGTGGTDERLYTAQMNVESNVTEYSKAFTVGGILRVIEAIGGTSGELSLYFNNRLILGRGEDRFASIAVTNFHDNIDMALQEAMNE